MGRCSPRSAQPRCSLLPATVLHDRAAPRRTAWWPLPRRRIASGARFHGCNNGRNNPWVYWPGGGGFFYDGAAYSEPFADAGQPVSNDVRYTYTYDVPWDWAHRFPPNVVPSDRPYVPSCPTESVTVPGRGGGEHTVNIMRCY